MVTPESARGVVYEVHGPPDPGAQLPGAASLPASTAPASAAPAAAPLLLQPPRATPASARTGRRTDGAIVRLGRIMMGRCAAFAQIDHTRRARAGQNLCSLGQRSRPRSWWVSAPNQAPNLDCDGSATASGEWAHDFVFHQAVSCSV